MSNIVINEDQFKILTKALEIWGKESQISMSIGEIGEYLTLFGRLAQGRATDEEFHSEIADNIIMFYQMAIVHGFDKVQEQINFKIERLNKKLEKQYAEQHINV